MVQRPLSHFVLEETVLLVAVLLLLVVLLARTAY